MRITKMQSDQLRIEDEHLVTVTDMGHLVEVQYVQRKNSKQTIQKLDAHRYMVLSTGEVKEFQKSTDRSQLANSFKKSMKRLRYLINNNFSGAANELFTTLTYAENMTDRERLYKDVDKFLKRLRYEYRDVSTIDYINVVEPQSRGAWHCHLLLRFNDLEEVYVPNEKYAELWGHGFVNVRRLENVDNIGAYLSAYLSDIPIDDIGQDEILKIFEIGETMPVKTVKEKRYIKGGRLYMYPTGINLYRASRGIRKPDRQEMSYLQVKEHLGDATKVYDSGYHLVDDETSYENIVIYEEYNSKR